jgi:D-lactate dehydrogenase
MKPRLEHLEAGRKSIDFALGIFAGSLTSTGTLQAATTAVGNQNPAIGYACAYPFGMFGLILRIMSGFGCKLMGFDQRCSPEFEEFGGRYAEGEQIEVEADIISLHCPLTPQTHHIVNARTLARVRIGALLIKRAAGVWWTPKRRLKRSSPALGGIAIDVYEQEAGLFFKDLSSTVIPDDVIQRFVSLPNVILSGHQGFFMREALGAILIGASIRVRRRR